VYRIATGVEDGIEGNIERREVGQRYYGEEDVSKRACSLETRPALVGTARGA
jgi:hypothetical protein